MFNRVLTWEDAYYDNFEQHDPLESKCFRETLENLCGGRFSHDPLGLAVAKMSYHVYCLGEGYGSLHEYATSSFLPYVSCNSGKCENEMFDISSVPHILICFSLMSFFPVYKLISIFF